MTQQIQAFIKLNKYKNSAIPFFSGVGYWNSCILLSFVFCQLSFLLLAAPVSAAQRPVVPSADDLTESLQGFHQSVLNLEKSNEELTRNIRVLKQSIQDGKPALQALKNDQARLEKEAALYGSKTAKKSNELNTVEVQVDEVKDRLQSFDQEKALKEQQLQARLREQDLIWEQLAAAKDEGAVDELHERNVKIAAEIARQKSELAQRLQDVRQRLQVLEAQLDEQSLLHQDPSLSLPRLTAKRDQLRQKIATLSVKPADSAQKPPVDSKELKALNFEVNGLAKKRSQQANLLQMLESQYDKNEKLTKNVPQEKKLQAAIGDLKKDNKLFRQQVADLRFEMINLDKHKARLEQLVDSVKIR